MLVEHYIQTRPYLYHLTHRDNLNHIREMACLFSAAVLMERSGNTQLMRTPRGHSVPVTVGHRTIVLRDQRPLYEGKMELAPGYSFGDFVESINRRVFFWPGKSEKPKDYGLRHFEHYKNEKPIIIRVEFETLCRQNHSATALFCRYNSGSPRVSYGNKSPRGPGTFLPAQRFSGVPSSVVEVTFESELQLPATTQFSAHPFGPWKKLL